MRTILAAIAVIGLTAPAMAQTTCPNGYDASGIDPRDRAQYCAGLPALLSAHREIAESSRKIQELDTKIVQGIYNAQVKTYGRQAVLECRSRMVPESPTYPYCLEANRGR